MKKLIFGVLNLLLVASPVSAQVGSSSTGMALPPEKMMLPQMLESQNYTYSVKEDGTAVVWLRVDSVTVPLEGGEFRYTLPEKATGTPKFWYRESGCARYQGQICTFYSQNWVEGNVTLDGKKVTAQIPKREVDARDSYVPMSVGLSYSLSDITEKHWWGRTVTITNGTTDRITQYVSVGVYVPDGLYIRDRQTEPSGWGNTVTTMLSQPAAQSDEKAGWDRSSVPMFDYIGGGNVYRSRNSVGPDEVYSFNFMTSGNVWKMYYRELGTAVLWLFGIALVLSLLLYMLVGKKTLRWYLALMTLLFILFLLLGGMWLTSRSVPGGIMRGYGDGPIMLDAKSAMESTPVDMSGAEPATESTPAETPAVEE